MPPALQIRITDPELQAYLQRYPFACGPDPAKNEAGLRQVAANLAERPAAPEVRPEQIPAASAGLPAEEQAVAARLMQQLGVSTEMRAVHRNDFAWEANLVPRTARNVLVIGCGNGIELIFLRAVLPQAKITGIDYYRSLLPGMEEAVGLRFLEGDMNRHLQSLQPEYDLIFSNHTLEHLYEPDKVIGMLAGLLVPGGHLTSILPMVGCEGTPFLGRIREAAQRHAIHPVDMPFLDPGHPWKTNPGDLKQTLEQAGLTEVMLYQREGHISRPLRRSSGMYRLTRGASILLNMLVVGPMRLALKLTGQDRPGRPAALLFALERRVPFGSNRVINNYSEEAFVIGRRAG